jgi:peptidoglycan hydrolase-like protein with peptidoglycan-binding domain
MFTRTPRSSSSARVGRALLGAALGVALAVTSITTASAATRHDSAVGHATENLGTRQVQEDLAGMGYLPYSGVDGVVGPVTQTAIEHLQDDACLSVDGIAGPRTDDALHARVAAIQGALRVGRTGVFSGSTQRQVAAWQRAHGLPATGQASAATMARMGIARVGAACQLPPANSKAGRIVRTARSQIGVLAVSNSDYCLRVKRPYDICAEWCAAFATWVWRSSGDNIPFETYVPDVWKWAAAHGRLKALSTAAPGDLIIFGTPSYRYHIGVVTRVSKGYVWVMAGDTGNPQTGQMGAWEKTFPLSSSIFSRVVSV